MTLLEFKKKVLALIEELNPSSAVLTDDPDISAKINEVINQIMFELARIKKIPKYIEVKVNKGETLDFAKLTQKVGAEVYQVGIVRGVDCEVKANGTVYKILESGTAEVECFVLPSRITATTSDSSYSFTLPSDLLEIMPYGVAGDLLKSDVSADFGRIYSNRYESMLQRLDGRYQLPSITISGGINI